MICKVCTRICEELQGKDLGGSVEDPLLWLLHGGPGTGKSEVVKMLKELFVEVCGWQMGLEFQVCSLQAVTAQLLDGDTIHHALGINPFGI